MHLKKANVHTLPALMTALKSSYTMPGVGEPVVAELHESADVTQWLRPHADHRLTGVTKAHQFVFELKEVDGRRQVVLSCKSFAASEQELRVGVLLLVSCSYLCSL